VFHVGKLVTSNTYQLYFKLKLKGFEDKRLEKALIENLTFISRIFDIFFKDLQKQVRKQGEIVLYKIYKEIKLRDNAADPES
jgi:hypothetical protein